MDKYWKLVEIAYHPEGKLGHWMVIRTGVVAEQGGLNFGIESLYFQTLSDAFKYTESCIERDLIEISRQIELKAKQTAG